MKTDHQNKKHIPVLPAEVLHYLDPKPGQSYLDLTAGYGGHAREVLERTLQNQDSVLVDRDIHAIEHLRDMFATGNIDIRHIDFYQAAKQLHTEGKQFDMILADLGVSSPHLDNASRGFSLKEEGPLDMRMDTSQPLTAAEVVNTYSVDELVKILREYGEEPRARAIAHLIVDNRPYKTTSELAQIVTRAWPGHSKVHPATRTFQALRIAVNDELRLIADTLPLCLELLNPDGRLVVISFHSLEDRIIKKFLNEHGGERYDAELKLLTKRPIAASNTELVLNPRARSAKLRAAVKINKRKGAANANYGKK